MNEEQFQIIKDMLYAIHTQVSRLSAYSGVGFNSPDYYSEMERLGELLEASNND